jgi:outer membrane protein TolC
MDKSIYHRLVRSFFVTFIIAVTLFSYGNSYAGEQTKLTLDDCIKAALENNLGLRGSDISTLSSELDFDIASSFFDPAFSANLSNSVTRRGGITLESQISGGSKSEYLSGDFEFSKQLFSGARWSVKYKADKSTADSILTEGGPSTAYASQTTLTYTHPLLEGGDTSVNKIGMQSAKIRNEQQRSGTENLARELVYQVKAIYYDILNSKETIDVAKLSLGESEKLLEFVKAQLEVGRVSSYEVLSAESGLASRQEALMIAQTNYLNNLDTMKNSWRA